MILGYLIISMLLSVIVAAISLLLGLFFLLALAFYSGVGALIALAFAIFHYTWPLVPDLLQAHRMQHEQRNVNTHNSSSY